MRHGGYSVPVFRDTGSPAGLLKIPDRLIPADIADLQP